MYFVLTFFCTILSTVIVLKKMYIKKKKIEKMSHSFNLKIEPKFFELLFTGFFSGKVTKIFSNFIKTVFFFLINTVILLSHSTNLEFQFQTLQYQAFSKI